MVLKAWFSPASLKNASFLSSCGTLATRGGDPGWLMQLVFLGKGFRGQQCILLDWICSSRHCIPACFDFFYLHQCSKISILCKAFFIHDTHTVHCTCLIWCPKSALLNERLLMTRKRCSVGVQELDLCQAPRNEQR
jgi:hypothetical protein